MRVIVHVNKFYDWVPVPADVTVTQADITSEKVKPASGGGWLMKVTQNQPTHTHVQLPEGEIIAKIIHDKCRPEGGRTLTRQQAVAFYLSENVMPHHAHRSFITSFEVEDDGPDEALMRSMLARHTVSGTETVEACVAAGTHAYVTLATATNGDTIARCLTCGHRQGTDTADSPNIPPEDLEAHVSAYTQPATASDHVSHLMGHFKVKAASAATTKTTATASPVKAVK